MGRFRRDAKGSIRADLHVIAARCALLIGRMYYEADDADRAVAWLNRALVSGHAADDELLVAYVLSRRANLAAARERVRMPAPIDAMARRHEAHGHAMAGDVGPCLRRLGEAADLLARRSDEDV